MKTLTTKRYSTKHKAVVRTVKTGKSLVMAPSRFGKVFAPGASTKESMAYMSH